MSVATESNSAAGPSTAGAGIDPRANTATRGSIPAQRPDQDGRLAPPWQETTLSPATDLASASRVEEAISAATADASRIGDLFEALRTARLWVPLQTDGPAVTPSGAVQLPTVVYLGSEFVAAYTSAELLIASAWPDTRASDDGRRPHAALRAADLARLLPPEIGIALNAGADQSVPIYPQGVAFLAADAGSVEQTRICVEPLTCQPDELLAAIRAGLAGIPQASEASAAWLSVQFSREGVVIAVTLDDPADPAAKDAVVAAVTRAADAARHEVQWPLDVLFPGEGEPDEIDLRIAACAAPFYRRG